jgi:hypothetical protein
MVAASRHGGRQSLGSPGRNDVPIDETRAHLYMQNE